jgi:enterochelin esterase family protein
MLNAQSSTGSTVGPPAHPLIRDLEETAPGADDIDRFLAQNEFPLIGCHTVTFVHRAEADAIYLRHWLKGPVAAPPLQRMDGTDLWHVTVPIAQKSRIEYKFDLLRDGNHVWVNDPLNPLVAEDPFGANSVCHAHGYETPEWSQPDGAAAQGRFESLTVDSHAFGEPRDIRVYLPEGYPDNGPYPLVIAHTT